MIAAVLFASCTDSDDAAGSSAVDNGTWTLDEAKDMSVKPGDDFFAYCNGTWIANTAYDPNDDDIVGFFYTQLAKNKTPLLTPDVMVTSNKLRDDAMEAAGKNVEKTDAMLQLAIDALNAATTREELWKTTAQLMKQGYQQPFMVIALPKTGRVCGLFMKNSNEWMEVPAMGKGTDMLDRMCNAEFAESLVPIADGQATRGSVNGEWLMLQTICEELGYDPADIYISAEDFSFGHGQGNGNISEIKQIQDMEVDELRQLLISSINNDRAVYSPDITMKYAVGLFAGKLKAYLNYDVSARFGRACVTEEMCQRGRDWCEQLRRTFRKRLEQNTWLSDGTKKQALQKLDAMNVFAGKPDDFYEEGIADISACETLLEDVMTLRKAYGALQHRLVGLPLRDAGFHLYISTFNNLTVENASYMPIANSIFILPIWLMSPVYQEGANSAYNFATVCCVIGHEITHGFDTSGSIYNKYGDIGSIWTSESDAQAFKQRADALKAYHSSIELLPGVYANGEKTIGEDIADLGGFEIAFQTYSEYLTANGFKGEQLRLQQRRFYEAFAYLWRAKYSEKHIKSALANDVHSLSRERVNGVVANTEAWYDLFDIKPGDKLYRKPEDRIHIW